MFKNLKKKKKKSVNNASPKVERRASYVSTPVKHQRAAALRMYQLYARKGTTFRKRAQRQMGQIPFLESVPASKPPPVKYLSRPPTPVLQQSGIHYDSNNGSPDTDATSVNQEDYQGDADLHPARQSQVFPSKVERLQTNAQQQQSQTTYGDAHQDVVQGQRQHILNDVYIHNDRYAAHVSPAGRMRGGMHDRATNVYGGRAQLSQYASHDHDEDRLSSPPHGAVTTSQYGRPLDTSFGSPSERYGHGGYRDVSPYGSPRNVPVGAIVPMSQATSPQCPQSGRYERRRQSPWNQRHSTRCGVNTLSPPSPETDNYGSPQGCYSRRPHSRVGHPVPPSPLQRPCLPMHWQQPSSALSPSPPRRHKDKRGQRSHRQAYDRSWSRSGEGKACTPRSRHLRKGMREWLEWRKYMNNHLADHILSESPSNANALPVKSIMEIIQKDSFQSVLTEACKPDRGATSLNQVAYIVYGLPRAKRRVRTKRKPKKPVNQSNDPDRRRYPDDRERQSRDHSRDRQCSDLVPYSPPGEGCRRGMGSKSPRKSILSPVDDLTSDDKQIDGIPESIYHFINEQFKLDEDDEPEEVWPRHDEDQRRRQRALAMAQRVGCAPPALVRAQEINHMRSCLTPVTDSRPQLQSFYRPVLCQKQASISRYHGVSHPGFDAIAKGGESIRIFRPEFLHRTTTTVSASLGIGRHVYQTDAISYSQESTGGHSSGGYVGHISPYHDTNRTETTTLSTNDRLSSRAESYQSRATSAECFKHKYSPHASNSSWHA